MKQSIKKTNQSAEITSGKPSRGTRTSKPDGGCP